VLLLVFNAGSSSLKFDLVEVAASGQIRRLQSGSFVDRADAPGLLMARPPISVGEILPPIKTLAEAAVIVLDWLRNPSLHGRDLLAGLDATVHRIVHGGAVFRATTRLGDVELAALEEVGALAPLHNPPAMAVIGAVRSSLGAALPAVAVFDTAYYAELPEAAYRYAVPTRWSEELGVRRYGFHGIAHRYLCQQARARLAKPSGSKRIVSLQLGRGCSVTATLDRRAIATSMGFTPLEGLVMGTRSGDVDPGALLYVMERSGLSAAQMRRELNHESGLLGLSGRTADMRDLLALEAGGEPGAALAIEVFCRRARHYVAGFMAELGGADAIVFGGGIGENCPAIRRRIVASLDWAGVALDESANLAAIGVASSVAAPTSRVAIEVIPVDEASIIAGEAATLLAAGERRS
jgi:acetate kinase